MYTCKFCGYYSPSIEDFEPDEQMNKGFWCPCCDGFTYFDAQTDRHYADEKHTQAEIVKYLIEKIVEKVSKTEF